MVLLKISLSTQSTKSIAVYLKHQKGKAYRCEQVSTDNHISPQPHPPPRPWPLLSQVEHTSHASCRHAAGSRRVELSAVFYSACLPPGCPRVNFFPFFSICTLTNTLSSTAIADSLHGLSPQGLSLPSTASNRRGLSRLRDRPPSFG